MPPTVGSTPRNFGWNSDSRHSGVPMYGTPVGPPTNPYFKHPRLLDRTSMMRTSRTPLALLALPFALVACGDGGAPAEEVPEGPPVVTTQVEELSTGELLGLDRENLASTTPWRAGAVTRTASDVAPTATQAGVDALTADGFDRLVLGFTSGTPAPGYQVRPMTEGPTMLCGEETEAEGTGVLVTLTPATLRGEDGSRMITADNVDVGLPVVTGARLLCESAREVTWLVETSQPEVEVRVLNLVSPERIAIDVRRGDTGPQ